METDHLKRKDVLKDISHGSILKTTGYEDHKNKFVGKSPLYEKKTRGKDEKEMSFDELKTKFYTLKTEILNELAKPLFPEE